MAVFPKILNTKESKKNLMSPKHTHSKENKRRLSSFHMRVVEGKSLAEVIQINQDKYNERQQEEIKRMEEIQANEEVPDISSPTKMDNIESDY